MSEAFFRAKSLKYEYPLGSQRVEALRGVSLDVFAGDFVCLLGPSGSGKSTLLNLFGLIEPVQSGELWLKGEDLTTLSERRKNQIRRYELGFVFQSFQLFPVLTAEENIEYFLLRQKLSRSVRKKRVEEALEWVGLEDHRHKKPLEMSGGQRQRVAIARAVARRPQVMIADEPTASLDQNTGRTIMELFTKMNRDKGITVILASHDPMVFGFARTLVRLQDGRIVQVGLTGSNKEDRSQQSAETRQSPPSA